MLFIGSCAGKFYALDKDTGKEIWSYDTRVDGGPRSFHGNPLIHEGAIFIATDRGCGPEGGGYVYAFELKSGMLRWKLPASGPSSGFAQINHAIVFGTREGQWVSAEMNSGKVNWTFPEALPGPQCEIRTSPVTDGAGVYFAAPDASIYALNPSGGKIWVQKQPSSVTTSLFLYKDVLYFGTSDGRVVGLNPRDGRALGNLNARAVPRGRFAWSHQGGRDVAYAFATHDEESLKKGMLLAMSDEFERVLWSISSEKEWASEQPHVWKNWIIAGNCRGDVVAYRATDGQTAWTDHVKGCIRSFGHDDSTLYIGVQEGTVYAYQPPTSPTKSHKGD